MKCLPVLRPGGPARSSRDRQVTEKRLRMETEARRAGTCPGGGAGPPGLCTLGLSVFPDLTVRATDNRPSGPGLAPHNLRSQIAISSCHWVSPRQRATLFGVYLHHCRQSIGNIGKHFFQRVSLRHQFGHHRRCHRKAAVRLRNEEQGYASDHRNTLGSEVSLGKSVLETAFGYVSSCPEDDTHDDRRYHEG